MPGMLEARDSAAERGCFKEDCNGKDKYALPI